MHQRCDPFYNPFKIICLVVIILVGAIYIIPKDCNNKKNNKIGVTYLTITI